jgi:hypothetical protein
LSRAPRTTQTPPTMRRLRHAVLFLPFAFALVACEKAPAPTTTPAPGAETPAADAPPPPSRFAEMNHDQKMEHMAKVVEPKMAVVFKAGDAARYEKFGCETCHVNHAPRPQDVLPKLKLSGDGFQKMMAEKPEVTKFMAEQVVPAMAEVMGEKPFDPTTGQGFGCAGCHAVE